MYIPRFNAVEDRSDIVELVRTAGAADLVTVDAEGRPQSTLLPIIWEIEDAVVVAHMARANTHWRSIIDGGPALAIVHAPQAYVSPAWYATKAEHGRVVPTWNYSAVHFTGTVTVHDDPAWVRDAVERLTRLHEGDRPEPWSVSDAPERYVEGQLRAIVGIELRIDEVQAKAKLSQNRSQADRDGAVAGMRAEGGPEAHLVADAMERVPPRDPSA